MRPAIRSSSSTISTPTSHPYRSDERRMNDGQSWRSSWALYGGARTRPGASQRLAHRSLGARCKPFSEPPLGRRRPRPGDGGNRVEAARRRFTSRVDNPWFPLTPGTTLCLRESGAEGGARRPPVMRTATAWQAPLRGRSRSVVPRRTAAERTTDWYAQDSTGNVWYFGEETSELERKGRVTSTEGLVGGGRGRRQARYLHAGGAAGGAGVPAGAVPGPRRGPFQGDRSVRGHGSGKRGGRAADAEWTPLEPGTIDHKLYVRGVGTVVERSVKGGNEYLELISVRSADELCGRTAGSRKRYGDSSP